MAMNAFTVKWKKNQAVKIEKMCFVPLNRRDVKDLMPLTYQSISHLNLERKIRV